MRVLHVCESIIGGTGSYLSEVIVGQVKLYGAENICLLAPDSQKGFLENDVVETGVEVRWFHRPDRRRGIASLAREHARCVADFRPDVVHAHSSIAGVVTRLWRPPGDYGLVFCPHGWAFDIAKSRTMGIIAAVAEFILSFRADGIILISRHEYARARDIHIDERRLNVVLNGIDAAVPAVEPAPWRDDRLKVLFVGRLDYQKGVDILLDAVKPLTSSVALRVIGDLAVDKPKRDLKADSTAEFLGWMSRLEVAAQMAACDVLVVPSRWEGFGLVVVEAMRMGKPVVGTAVGGLREILDNTKFGFVVPANDPIALRECLLSLPRGELNDRGAAGYRRFLDTYTSERMVRQIDAVYRKALDR